MTWVVRRGCVPANLTTIIIRDKTTSSKSYATIKLGIDAQAKWYYVARQVDGATPQPVQKMDLDGLLHFVAKQQRLLIGIPFFVKATERAGRQG